jgi:hypothetical protein
MEDVIDFQLYDIVDSMELPSLVPIENIVNTIFVKKSIYEKFLREGYESESSIRKQLSIDAPRSLLRVNGEIDTTGVN